VTKKFTELEFKGLTKPVSGKSGSSDIVDVAGFAGFMAKAYALPTGKPVLKPVPHFKPLEHTSGLIKAHDGASGKKPDYGFVTGMKIIAIGPKGGKIVGYDINHKPIYGGSPKAVKLKSVSDTVEKYGEDTPDLHVLGQEWLTALGIHTPAVTTKAAVISSQDGAKLLHEYGIKTTPLALGQTAGVTWAEVIAHMGKPLIPHASKLTVAAHNLAAGVPDGKVFPEEAFATLKITGDLGGTHAPKKAVDASGNQFVWKTNKGDVVSSWGEETFNKVASLVSTDPSLYPKAQVGELAGKTGVLLEWKDSSGTLGSGAAGANVPEGALKKYASQLARAHVLDWLMANHDGHGGNFLLSPDGKKLYPVDKGQAFKWIGHDSLSTEYHPNEHEPVYNKLWKLVEGGKLDTVTVGARADREHLAQPLDRAVPSPRVALRRGTRGEARPRRPHEMEGHQGALHEPHVGLGEVPLEGHRQEHLAEGVSASCAVGRGGEAPARVGRADVAPLPRYRGCAGAGGLRRAVPLA
jgi:hypothetical protein